MKKISAGLAIVLVMVFFSWDRSGAETLTGDPGFLSGLPEVKKHRMKNDINILYLEDDLPVTAIYASISFGKMYENSDNAGIAEVLEKALILGGSAAYPGNSISQKLESIGGEIHISAGWETIGIQIKVLSKYRDLALNILGDIIKNPVLEEPGVNSAKRLAVEKLKRDMDEPDEVGVLKLREIIFGGKGYGAVPTVKSIWGTEPQSLKNLWRRFATGGNITVAVSSSDSEKEIIPVVEKELSSVAKGTKEYYSIDKEKILAGLKSSAGIIYLVPLELEQATIYVGTLAPDIRYKGDYALYIMNYILGGGSFNSRLMNEIRVRRGLAYSVYSIVRNRRNAGVFISFAQTKNESVVEVLSLIDENIKKIHTVPVSIEELQWAKESVKNSYVFKFNNIDDLLGNYLEIEYNDLDADYYKKYLANINRVTAEDIMEQGSSMFSQGLVTVVVGSRKLEKDLSSRGKVIICEQDKTEGK